jgi:cystathionine beta-lyase
MSQFSQKVERRGSNCIKYDALKERYGSSDLQPLWIADMDFKTPEFITDAVIQKAKESLFGYNFIADDVYDSLISWQKRRNDWGIKKEDIFFVPSVLVGMSIALKTFTSEGDGVIIQTPVYPPFSSIVKDNKRKLITNELKNINGRYEMDLDDLESKIDENTKMIFLCSPHNPVGRVWSENELKRLGEICIKNDILIVSDEIHSDLVHQKFIPISKISKELADRTICFSAPTKTFNIAGLKIAYAICKNEELLRKLKKAINFLHIAEINTLGIEALKSAYENGADWVDEVNGYLYENYKFLKDYFTNNMPDIKIGELEATYLIWLDFSSFEFSHKELRDKLINEAKIVLNDGLTFGKNGNKFFRINIALSRSELEIALDKIKRTFYN